MASLNTSQTAVFQFKTIWQKYLKSLENSDNLVVLQAVKQASLASFQDGILKLQCNSPVVATQIKHQAPSIISFINQNHEFANKPEIEIKKIEVQVKPLQVNSKSATEEQRKLCNRNVDEKTPELLDKLSSNIKSEKLAESLKKLAETMKNNSHEELE